MRREKPLKKNRELFALAVKMLCALCITAFWSACSQAPSVGDAGAAGIDLADRFHVVPGESAPAGHETVLKRHYRVTRRGKQMDTTTLIGPAVIRAGLADLSGKFALKMLASPLFNVGDGVQMDIILGGAGDRRPIGSRYFDAGRRAENRDWIALSIPIDLTGAADAYLEIRLSAGPQGDLVADWLALAEVRIIQERAAR
jgi:hypothetical protein